jgi:hypothetical protein
VLNEKQRAIHHLQRSLELEPGQPDAGQLRFQIDRLRSEASLAASEPVPSDIDESASQPVEPGILDEGGP